MTRSVLGPSSCNNAVLRQCARRLGRLYDGVLAPSGLHVTQHTILAQIQFMNSPTLRELAGALVMDLSALGHTLRPLVRDGFVELVADKNDRRAKRAKLTEAGIGKLRETSRLWRVAQNRFEKAFGANCAADLRSILIFLASQEFNDAFLGVAV